MGTTLQNNLPELYEAHEAGHAVAAYVLGIPFTHIKVAPLDLADSSSAPAHVFVETDLMDADGRIANPIAEDQRPQVWPLAVMLLAGIATVVANTAGDRAPYDPRFLWLLAERDIRQIDELFAVAGLLPAERERLTADTVDLVYRNWPAVRAVIEALLVTRELQRRKAEEIIQAALAEPHFEPPHDQQFVLETTRKVMSNPFGPAGPNSIGLKR